MINSNLKVWFLLALFAVFVTGCSTGLLQGPEKTYKKDSVQLFENEAQLVIFRDKETKGEGGSTILRMDDQLVGALLPGQYVTTKVCEGTSQLKVSARAGAEEFNTVNLHAEEGETLFFRIWEVGERRYDIEKVADNEAKGYLADSKYSSYLKTRRQPVDCVVPVLLKEVALGADALFQFDRAEMSDILDREALDRLAEEILHSELDIDRIKVVGHTDRLGGEEYNQKLSEQRAATVADYLRLKGVTGLIDIEGKGASDPVIDHCEGNRATPELIECLQPNRRVMVEFWGFKEEVLENKQIQTQTTQDKSQQ